MDLLILFKHNRRLTNIARLISTVLPGVGFVRKGRRIPSEHLSLLSGRENEDILDTTHISAENKKKYSKVIEEFERSVRM